MSTRIYIAWRWSQDAAGKWSRSYRQEFAAADEQEARRKAMDSCGWKYEEVIVRYWCTRDTSKLKKKVA